MTTGRPRVLSGMRPTGMLHLGHSFLLEKWVAMQDEFACNYFIADFHALTTAATETDSLERRCRDMVVCWLAAGLDPDKAVLFRQSDLREHAELHVLLSMIVPLPWLERIPHFKDMAGKVKRDDINYGFLGYPVLQAADIIAHGADCVPVGDDQEAHVEMTARIARAFNDQFGKDCQWQEKTKQAIGQLERAGQFESLCKKSRQEGDSKSREQAYQMVHGAGLDRELTQLLLGHVDGTGRQILKPPQALKANVSRLPGLDGKAKMSKSESNDIGMLEEKSSYAKKIKVMPTDPARVRRTDPGNPENCSVWNFHQVFTSGDECKRLHAECSSAGIGCVDCKNVLVDSVEEKLSPIRERAQPWLGNDNAVDKILAEGAQRAREYATMTMKEARQAVGLPTKLA